MRHAAPALALVLVAGCAAPAPAAGPVPVEKPAPAAASTATPAPARVGGKQTSADAESSMDVTVLRLRIPFTPTVPDDVLGRKGYVYAGVEVKACATRNVGKLPIGVSWGPWSLTYASGVVVEAASSYGDDWWDEPLYPQEHIVATGRCVRGWIPFEVRSSDGRPERVAYTPSATSPLEWTVAAS